MLKIVDQKNNIKEEQPVDFNEKLIKELKERDVDAVKNLIDHFSSPLYGFVKRMVGDDKVAAEVLQTSFLNICNAIGLYNHHHSSLFTWMSNITRDTALAWLGSKPGKKVTLKISSDSVENGISLSSAHQQVMIDLHHYINQLLPEYRVVWELSFIRGYSHEEISGLLRITPDMVKTKLNNACMELLMLADSES